MDVLIVYQVWQSEREAMADLPSLQYLESDSECYI